MTAELIHWIAGACRHDISSEHQSYANMKR